MKAILLLLSLAISSQAILIDPGPRGTTSFDKRINFQDLNGTSLMGQSLSLNFEFPQDRFIRLLPGATSYTVMLTFKTNASSLVGFMHGQACLTDQFGNELNSPLELGSASGDNGILACGLFPSLSVLANGHHGARFDLDLPSAPYQITGAEFRMISSGAPFITGAHIADTGSTLFMLVMALSAIVYRRT